MNKKIAFALFLTLAVVITVGVNYYVIGRLWTLFSLSKNLTFYIILAVLTFSFIISTFLVRWSSNIIFKAYYFLSTLWLGIMLILLSLLLVFEAVNLFYTPSQILSGIAILDIAFLLTLYSIVNAFGISTKEVEIPIKLDSKKKLNIVQISDVHLGVLRNQGYLKRVVNKINSLKPDITVITGDLFDGGSKMTLEEVKPLDRIKSPVYFVIGNHEIYEGLDSVMKILSKTKVKTLRNKKIMEKGIQIIGIDFSEDKGFLEETLKNIKINKNKPSLLLYHTPIDMNILTQHKINLHLAGHTHKGQVFPFSLLVRLAFRHIAGLKQKDDSYQYVSQGTGTWGPFMRLGSQNEVTRIKVR